MLVTQQPGSIPAEILSQGDNWFLFHLLSSGDLSNVRSANAHFGQDLLSALLNEPIPGQGVFWSSVGGKQYPVPLRVLSFEAKYGLQDPQYDRQAIETYAGSLRTRIGGMVQSPQLVPGTVPVGAGAISTNGVEQSGDPPAMDLLRTLEMNAIKQFRESEHPEKIRFQGMAWGSIRAFLRENLPQDLDDRDQFAYNLVQKALNEVIGQNRWETYKPDGRDTTWVRPLPR